MFEKVKTARWLCFIVVLSMWLITPPPALADDPPGWPWRGITLSSLDTSPDDIAVIKVRLGANSVRLTMDARAYGRNRRLLPEEALKLNVRWAHAMLDACRENGITGVLSMSQFPIDPGLGITQESPKFWNNAGLLDETVKISAMLAREFKGRGPELGAYDILNEPLLRDGAKAMVPPQWPATLKRIIKAIRDSDRDRWIVVAPGPGGLPAGYSDFSPLPDARIIYGAHMYVPHAFTHQGIEGRPLGYEYPGRIGLKYWDRDALGRALSELKKFQRKNKKHVWIGEFSAARWAKGSDRYLLDLVELFEENGWGWAYFNYKDYHGWNPDYNSEYSTNDFRQYKNQFVGEKSARWGTLRKMFGK